MKKLFGMVYIRTKETALERADRHPSAINVSIRREVGANVYDFRSFHVLSAVVHAFISKGRLRKALTKRSRSQLFLI